MRVSIESFVRAVHAPVNILARKDLAPVPELERMGVRRLSLGPAPMYTAVGLLKRVGVELRQKGTYKALTRGAVGYDELMSLASPRKR